MRNRFLYSIYIVIVIVLGLASRKFTLLQWQWITLYLGDLLWSLMVFFIFGFVFIKRPTYCIASFALLFSIAIELSQLYHAPWIDSIRSTRIGGLILGFGFLWSDLVCYVVGVAIGILIEKFIIKVHIEH